MKKNKKGETMNQTENQENQDQIQDFELAETLENEKVPKQSPGKSEAPDPTKPQKTDLPSGAHKQKGYVTKSGILFPVGFKFKGGHISSKGNVVLNTCPKCGHQQYPAQAVKGFCEKLNEKTGCGFDKTEELEHYQL